MQFDTTYTSSLDNCSVLTRIPSSAKSPTNISFETESISKDFIILLRNDLCYNYDKQMNGFTIIFMTIPFHLVVSTAAVAIHTYLHLFPFQSFLTSVGQGYL